MVTRRHWGEVKKLLASDSEAGDNFGWSVAMSGDTAIVGARREDAGGSQAGAAYVLQRDEGSADNWGEVQKLTASDAEAEDLFGFSVAVSGDTVVVGARLAEAGDVRAGAAYVFGQPVLTPTPANTSTSTPTQAATPVPPTPAIGAAVSLP